MSIERYATTRDKLTEEKFEPGFKERMRWEIAKGIYVRIIADPQALKNLQTQGIDSVKDITQALSERSVYMAEALIKELEK